MISTLNYSVILSLYREVGFVNKYYKAVSGLIYAIDKPSIQYDVESLSIFQKFDCPSDKSTLHLFITPYGEKGVYVDFWEHRLNF